MSFITSLASTLAPSTTSSLVQTTTLSPQPLTTPFIRAATCDAYWSVERVYDNTTTIVPSKLPGCLPTGWTNSSSEIGTTFRPAVCPADWTAYNLGSGTTADYRFMSTWTATSLGVTTVRSKYYTEIAYLTTAYCCSKSFTLSGYTYGYSLSPDLSCVQTVYSVSTDVGSMSVPPSGDISEIQTLFTRGVKAHGAWHIAWGAADRSTLTPKPPTISWGLISSWVPGEAAATSTSTTSYRNSDTSSGEPGLSGAMTLAVVLSTALGLALITCCVCCLCSKSNSGSQSPATRLPTVSNTRPAGASAGARANTSRTAARGTTDAVADQDRDRDREGASTPPPPYVKEESDPSRVVMTGPPVASSRATGEGT